MRHGDKINNLGRTVAHRRALLANLAIALIEHKRINTTLAKAKALRKYVEPLVTKAKDNTTHSRRVVFSYLQNKDAVKELFSTVAAKIGDRPGGYVRVIKLGFRRGDGAEVAMIEFVDFNETYNPKAGKEATKKKTRRGAKKPTESKVSAKVTAAAAAAAAVPVVDEAPEVEEIEDVVETPVMEETVAAAEEQVAATEEVVAEAEPEMEAPAAEADETPAAEETTEEEKKDEEA